MKDKLVKHCYEVEGLTMGETSRKLDISVWQVRKALQELGVVSRSRCPVAGKTIGQKAERSKGIVSDAELTRMYVDEQMPVMQISKSSGLTSSLITGRLKDLGIMRSSTKGTHLNSVEDHPNWKGGRYMQNGYWWVMVAPGKYRLEHRVVMEKMLSRKLQRREVVHHKDCDGLNNDPANLQLFPGNREHRAEHARMRKEQVND